MSKKEAVLNELQATLSEIKKEYEAVLKTPVVTSLRNENGEVQMTITFSESGLENVG